MWRSMASRSFPSAVSAPGNRSWGISQAESRMRRSMASKSSPGAGPGPLRERRITSSCCDLGGVESARSGWFCAGPGPREENHVVMRRVCSGYARGMLGVCSRYAQGMLRVCSGYAQGSVRAGWEGFGGSGGARDTREWDPTRTLGPKKVMKQVWG